MSVLIAFGKCFYFENFQKFQKLCNSILATCLMGQASRMPQSRAYTECFRDSLAGQSPNRKKEIENFSKIWVFRFLATQFGNLFASGSSSHEVYLKSFVAPFATHFNRENHVLCALRTVFKNLSIFPSLTFTFHCLVRSSLSQTHRVLSKNAPFFFFIST